MFLLVASMGAIILGIERYFPSAIDKREVRRGPTRFEREKVTRIEILTAENVPLTLVRDGNAWLARTNAVLPDGSQTSSLNVYTYDGKDRCTWQSLHTNVGSEHAPPVNMTMIRKPGRPTK